MSITKGTWDLHKAGSKDAYRHKQKLHDAFRERLHDIISQEDIITSEKGKTVKIPIKALDNWHFIFDRKKQTHVGQGDGELKPGDILQEEKEKGKGDKAGDEPGIDYYEAEIDLDDIVELMLEDLKLPRLDPKKSNSITASDIRFDDIRKKGSIANISKRRTLLENLKRNAAKGNPKIDNISQEDLRYRTWTEYQRPITSAVVLALMDVSGSMGQDKKYIARSFYFWMVNFLRHKYENVDIKFISHTTEAKICTEEEFFYKGESGGTMCSSAYQLALQTINAEYPPSEWNIFTFHFSDGETWQDEDDCVSAIRELSKLCNMVGYGEIDLNKKLTEQTAGYMGMYWSSKLSEFYARNLADCKNFVQRSINDKDEVWPALKEFFSEELTDE